MMNETTVETTRRQKRTLGRGRRRASGKRVVEGGEFNIGKGVDLTNASSSSSSSLVTPVVNGTLDDKTTWFMRQYLDMAFSSALMSMAMAENTSMSTSTRNALGEQRKFIGCRDIASAIPGTVYNILRYNGCQFAKIRFYTRSVNLFEPIWYNMNLDKHTNYLELFINETMIDQFCRKTNNDMEFVQLEPPITRLSNYNLDVGEMMQHDMQRFITASMKLVMLCDHVCQHILSELHNRNIPKASKLHDPQFFCKHGTTINSMFRITQTGTKMPDKMLFVAPHTSTFLPITNLMTNQGNQRGNYLDRLTS